MVDFKNYFVHVQYERPHGAQEKVLKKLAGFLKSICYAFIFILPIQFYVINR